MSRSNVPLPMTLDPRGFRVRTALAEGVPYPRLRRSDLVAPFHGVRCESADTIVDRATALASVLAPHQALGGFAAAELLGLPIPHRIAADSRRALEVVSPRSRSRCQFGGTIARRVRDDAFSSFVFRGVPMVVPSLLIVTLGAELSEHDLVVLIDALRSDSSQYPGLAFRRRPFVTADYVAAIPLRHARLHGIGKVRAAVARSRDGVRSPMETRLRLRLVDAGLPEPEVNPRIELPGGRHVFPDLLWRAARVTAEYEGEHHLLDVGTWSSDIARTRAITHAGFQEFRVTKSDLFEPGLTQLVRQLQHAISTRTVSNDDDRTLGDPRSKPRRG